MILNRLADSGKPSPLRTAQSYVLWSEQNLTSFTDAIIGQIPKASPSEADRIVRLAYASMRARQSLREVLR